MSPQILPMRSRFPSAPAELSEAGKQAWRRGAQLWVDGSLVERDLAGWLNYCKAHDEIAHCLSVVAESGEYFQTKNGAIIQHPAINRRFQVEKTIQKYEKLFGLVPDARRKRPAVQQGVVSRKR